MSANTIPAPWQEFKLQLRKTWDQLTDADLEAISSGCLDIVDAVHNSYGPSFMTSKILPGETSHFQRLYPLKTA